MSDDEHKPTQAEIAAAIDYVCGYFEINGVDVDKLEDSAIRCCMSLWLETQKENNKVDSLNSKLKQQQNVIDSLKAELMQLHLNNSALEAKNSALKEKIRHEKSNHEKELISVDKEHFDDLTALEEQNRDLRRQLLQYEDRCYQNNQHSEPTSSVANNYTKSSNNDLMAITTWDQLEQYASGSQKYAIREHSK